MAYLRDGLDIDNKTDILKACRNPDAGMFRDITELKWLSFEQHCRQGRNT